MATPLEELLARYLALGTINGAVALLGRDPDVEVVSVGVASAGGGAMPIDAIMRIQSMTKVITSIAALRLVAGGSTRGATPDPPLSLDQSVVKWLPELANRRVLRDPTGPLDDTVPASHDITLRHLMTNTSGYGIAVTESPLQRAMADNGTEVGAEPPPIGADEWVARLAELPLAFQPGEGWRYHHSYALLGVLLARLTGRPLDEHLAEDVFGPLGMTDTALSVPESKLERLPAAYRHGEDGLVEVEPAGGGFYAGPPPFDVSHGELVSTVSDFHRITRLLVNRGRVDGTGEFLPAALVDELTRDQVPASSKTPDSFYPGFWDGMGWGFGVAVHIDGPHRGRYGWSGGQGTDFFVDPDGTVGILLTQAEMGQQMWPLLQDFQSLSPAS
jgi:CubicO group peptidase (beta-lactamase class C family)